VIETRVNRTERDGNNAIVIRRIKPFPLRLSPELRQRLQQRAEQRDISLQAEITAILERALNTPH